MMNIFSNRSGITILETVVVLIIGSLVISGIWITYSQMTLNEKINRTVIAIDKTAIATWDFLASRATIPTDLSFQMHDRDLMPPEVKFSSLGVSQAIYTSPLGTPLYVSAFANNQNRMFVIRLGVNADAQECARLIPLMLGNIRLARARGIVGFILGTISRGPQTPGQPAIDENDIPTRQEIITQCETATIVRFIYEIKP